MEEYKDDKSEDFRRRKINWLIARKCYGGLFDQKAKNAMQTVGGITTAVGLFGFAACAIAGNICELKGKSVSKSLFIARDAFMGVAALGGGTYAIGKVG